ncbi:uncharacterized protein PG986_008473 [Apiospora aurea]|uniref:Uncharacterized protein n=1 Tax=Apiospora aurea TaxID=335848 RepID=A0ABR1QFJ1_9PEZI
MDGAVFTQTPEPGIVPTNTIWLPAQTTPFTTRKVQMCEPKVDCAVTAWYCGPVYLITNDLRTPAITFLETTRRGLSLRLLTTSECDLAAAYTGSACMKGWQSACDTAFEYRGQEHSQTWCCPIGPYQCSTLALEAHSTKRICFTPVTDPTLYYSLGSGSMIGVEAQVQPIRPPESAWRYTINAFPLQAPASTAGSVSPNPDPISATAISRDQGSLSKGQVAGIAVGSCVLGGIIVALILVQIRRRRRHLDTYQGKPELHATNAPRAELEGHGMYPEMDGRSQPTEAPAMHPLDMQARTSTNQEAAQSDRGVQELPSAPT